MVVTIAMSDPSSKVKCPDCSMMVHRRNISKHYRRMHPGLDYYKSLRRVKEEPKVRRPHFESSSSWIVGAFVAVAIVALLVVGSLIVISLINEGGDSLIDRRHVYFAASDGAVINATWYQSSEAGSPTIYLIHDIGSDRTIWKDYARELQSDGYNVMAIDTRGHGESTKSLWEPDYVYDYRVMSHYELELVSLDVQAAYDWVHGTDLGGELNSDAGEEGAFVGIGKGGQYAMKEFSRMSRERIISGCIISPTLDNYGLDVDQIFEDWGDVRPIIMARSEGDGTGELAMNTILTRKELDEEKNGIGFIVPGSNVGYTLLVNKDLKENILEVFEDTWGISPG
jgi:pimeloyl-ACP methyl ester carboxylesterase